MAKVQLSMEEFLQVIRGEVNLPETRENIAKALMTVWKSEAMQTEIEAHAEHLGKTKMERIINDSLREEKVSYYGTKTELRGWAAEVIKEQIRKENLSIMVELMQPELERTVNEVVQRQVSDLVQRQIGAIFLDMMKKSAGE
jgi:hypothetical protein